MCPNFGFAKIRLEVLKQPLGIFLWKNQMLIIRYNRTNLFKQKNFFDFKSKIMRLKRDLQE